MSLVIYFSSTSENTKTFVEKLGIRNLRIPLLPSSDPLVVDEPYILVCPSYGAGRNESTVPKQVIKFLNNEQNRKHILAVAGGGNQNYGAKYCRAAQIISEKCKVPLVFTFEILGLPEDVKKFKEIVETFERN